MVLLGKVHKAKQPSGMGLADHSRLGIRLVLTIDNTHSTPVVSKRVDANEMIGDRLIINFNKNFLFSV